MKLTRENVMRLVLAAALAATPVTAAIAREQGAVSTQGESAGRAPGGLTVPVSGIVRPPTGGTPSSPLTGTLKIQRFAATSDGVVAIGTLTASFVDPLSQAARTVVTQVQMPLDRDATSGQTAVAEAAVEIDDVPVHGPAVSTQAACDILHLVLGPLDLDLLGLRIELNQVVLDITAVPGAGNLLGNLLCAIVGLLDGPGPLDQLVALLNQLLAILG